MAYYSHERITQFDVKWKGRVYPQMSDNLANLYLFDSSNSLVALSLERRKKVAEQREYNYTESGAVLVPAAYISEMLADLPKCTDAGNVPLSEAEEERLAWLGVELQSLNRELARANGVSDETNDGESGAMISYVYPDSPAAQAGVEAGYVLLRLRVEGQPKPIEIHLDADRWGMAEGFPWEKLDDLPEQYYDQIPTPWSSAENQFTRALTDLGFGKKYTAEFFHDGKLVKHTFEIVQSPPHFGAAPRYKSDSLGLTVRDLTYEVRRYLQKKPTDPGVVVAKLEPGSKASVAGVKPYELITAVNGEPVASVKDFERLTDGKDELRLSVNRLAQGRTVKVSVTKGGKSKTKPEPASRKAGD